MRDLILDAALAIGGCVMLAAGFALAAAAVGLSALLLRAACTFFIKDALLETYNVALLQYYMRVMVALGRKGLLKHVENARKEQEHAHDSQ